MTQLEKAQARFAIDVADAAEIARLAGTQGRDMFAREDLEDQLGIGPLILDGLRRRPHYFDGRFLTGSDLTRDQDYVRQRQADMARASGSGIISGLQVRSFSLARGQTIRIEPGVGLTPSGDVVMWTRRRDVPLLDLPLSRQLDAAMGLREEPRVPLGRRTGLFILALRPVEFTANPIAAYPRTITGRRTVEDGDIIEATAITLIPYPETSGAANLNEARRAVAKQIFTGEPSGLPQEALPLAMLAVERGTVRWIDMPMVRRETGSDTGVHIMFGGRPRSLAEAHVLQHRSHLNDVLAEFQARGLPPIFTAAQHFATLPPAGQLPATAVQPDEFGFRQLYFPPSVDVDLAFVPMDEVGALVEESLSLPPIDLEAKAEDLDATGILILVPVTRQRFTRFDNALPSTTTSTVPDPGSGAGRAALDLLATLTAKRRKMIEAAERDAEAAAAAEAERLRIQAWHAAYQEAIGALPIFGGRPPLLWYTRRRSIAYQSRVVGVAVAVTGDDVALQAVVNESLSRLSLEKKVAELNGQATPQATARIISLLGSPAIAGSDILTAAVISDLEKVASAVDTPPIFVPPSTDSIEEAPVAMAARPTMAMRTASLRTAALRPGIFVGGGVVRPRPDVTLPVPPAPEPTPAPTPPKGQPAAEPPTPSPKQPPKAEEPPPTPAPTPAPAPAPEPLPAPTPVINPAVLGLDQPPSEDLAATRAGLNRIALAKALGVSTAQRPDTPLNLSEGEVLDVAQDYSSPNLGEGLARLGQKLGSDWPGKKGALWLGRSGKALTVDRAFRAVPGEQLADFAELLSKAVEKQDDGRLDKVLKQIR